MDWVIAAIRTMMRSRSRIRPNTRKASGRALKNQFIISSDGADPQWSDARRMCQRILDYGDWFGIVEENVAETWPGDPNRNRDVLLRTLVELDPAALG